MPVQAERETLAFLCPFVLFGLQLMEWRPPTLGRAVPFHGVLSHMIISSKSTLTCTPRNNVLLAIQAFFNSVKLTHKVKHHNKDVEKLEPSYFAGGM